MILHAQVVFLETRYVCLWSFIFGKKVFQYTRLKKKTQNKNPSIENLNAHIYIKIIKILHTWIKGITNHSGIFF